MTRRRTTRFIPVVPRGAEAVGSARRRARRSSTCTPAVLLARLPRWIDLFRSPSGGGRPGEPSRRRSGSFSSTRPPCIPAIDRGALLGEGVRRSIQTLPAHKAGGGGSRRAPPVHRSIASRSARRPLRSRRRRPIPPSNGTSLRRRRIPFGTDKFGRDVLSRVIYGARVSLGIAVSAVLLASLLGTLVGAASAYAGGRVGRRGDAGRRRFSLVSPAPPAPHPRRVFRELDLARRRRARRDRMDGVRETRSGRCARFEGERVSSRPRWRAARAGGGSCAGTSSPTRSAPSSWPRRSASPSWFCWSRISPFWGWAFSRRHRAGGAWCSTAAKCSSPPGGSRRSRVLRSSGTVVSCNLLGDGLRDALDVRMG